MGVEIIGLDMLRAKVQKLIDHKPQALRAAGIKLLQLAQQSIQEQGPGWAPFKKLPEHPHELLWDTGALYASLSPGNSENVLQIDGDTVTSGTRTRRRSFKTRAPARFRRVPLSSSTPRANKPPVRRLSTR